MPAYYHAFTDGPSWEDIPVLSPQALPTDYTSHATRDIPEQLLSEATPYPVHNPSSGPGGRQLYSKEQWEAQKPAIYRLYNQENKPYNRVVKILRMEHNFFPT